MLAWKVIEYGYYKDVLEQGEMPRTEPGPGQVEIRVGATALSFAQMLRIAGQYQLKDPLPFIPGMDAAGEVVAVGPECPFAVGDRVMGTAATGACAEYSVLQGDLSYRVPEAMPDTDAAAFLNAHQTSYVGLVHQGRLKAGEVVLVHGAAGGVGLAAIQIGRMLGATVIATASSPEKLAACTAQGAHHVIDYSKDDFVAAVQDITAGHGADVIYDPVGGDVFDRSRRCIAFDGRLVVVGFASGRIPEIAVNRMLLRTFSVTGFTLHAYKAHQPQVLEQAQQTLFDRYLEGHVKPVISHTLPMTRLVEGLDLLESRQVIGKVVLLPEWE